MIQKGVTKEKRHDGDESEENEDNEENEVTISLVIIPKS